MWEPPQGDDDDDDLKAAYGCAIACMAMLLVLSLCISAFVGWL